MLLFAKKIHPSTPFVKNESVVSLVELPGVPAGTEGKIKLSNGIDWQRYWVFFENGIDVGQVDATLLSRPQHFEMMKEKLNEIDRERATKKEEQKEQQEVLLDQLLNPPPEPEPVAEIEIASVETESAPAETSIDGGNVAAPAETEDKTEEAIPTTPETPTAPPAGSSLVDIPPHLLERATEARTRLS